MAKPHPQPDDPAQYQRFIDLAEEFGADGEGLDDAMRKVSAAKREPVPAQDQAAKSGKRQGPLAHLSERASQAEHLLIELPVCESLCGAPFRGPERV